METEFKIPTHPASDSLFSRHAMTALLAPSRVGEVGGRSASRTNRALHSPPGASMARSMSPGQAATGSSSLSPSKCSSVKMERTVGSHLGLTTKSSSSPTHSASHAAAAAAAATHTSHTDRLQHSKSGRTDPGVVISSPDKHHTVIPCRARKACSAVGSSPVCTSPSPSSSSLLTPIPHLSPTATKSTPHHPAEAPQPQDSAIFSQPRPTFDSDSCEVRSFQQPFYFESDHVALKTNQDYQTLLKTVTLLEAQRTKAIQDLDKLLVGQEKALEDPIAFVQKLQNREELGLPRPQKVAQIPQVAWGSYTGSIALEQKHKHRHMTRYNRTPFTSGMATCCKSIQLIMYSLILMTVN